MNTILQNRIEAAAKFIAVKNAPLIGTRLYDECCYNSAMEMATFALQNQWISVEEALPSYGSLCLVDGKNGLKLSIYMNVFVDAGNIT